MTLYRYLAIPWGNHVLRLVHLKRAKDFSFFACFVQARSGILKGGIIITALNAINSLNRKVAGDSIFSVGGKLSL